jgi:hypothetical protein
MSSEPPMTRLPPPGWYPDARDPHWQRWWDGRTWTETVRQAEIAAAAPAPVAARQGNAGAVVALVFGVVATGFALLGTRGLDPLLALLIVGCGTTALATGIPGAVKARRSHRRTGQVLGIVGAILGGAAVTLAVLAVVLVLTGISTRGA